MRQLRFMASLAKGRGPARAAAMLGLSRQTAYALRRRIGAEQFAAAWDDALRYARQCRVAEAAQSRQSRRN